MYLEFNEKNFEVFINLYESAVKNKQEKFVFENVILSTDYAKYLIEYITKNLKK